MVSMYSPKKLCFHVFCRWDAINSVLKIRRKERNADFEVEEHILVPWIVILNSTSSSMPTLWISTYIQILYGITT